MKVQWFSGPPPAVGWWPCGIDVYSWWDGKQWSGYVMRTADKDIAASIAQSFKANTDRHWRHWSIEIDGTDGRGLIYERSARPLLRKPDDVV